MKLSVANLKPPTPSQVEPGNVYPAEGGGVAFWLVVAIAGHDACCVGFSKEGRLQTVSHVDTAVLAPRPVLGFVDLGVVLTPTTLTPPEQDDARYRVLNLVELKILSHHGYISNLVQTPLSKSQEAAYRHLICKRLIKSTGDQDGYVVTERGEAHLDAIQHLALPEE